MAWRSQPRARSATRPLTPLSRPAFTRLKATTERQNRFHNPRVNESCFPDSKRLPSTNALSTRADRARHRTCDFASRRPASDALSPFLMLSRERARSSTVVTGYSPEVVSDHATLADFCNRNEMRAQPPDRPSPAHRAKVALCEAFYCGWPIPLSEISQLRFHGPGAFFVVLPHKPLRSRSLARRALPQPDRLRHLLSQTCFRRRLEKPPPKMRARFEVHPQGRRAGPRFRET